MGVPRSLKRPFVSLRPGYLQDTLPPPQIQFLCCLVEFDVASNGTGVQTLRKQSDCPLAWISSVLGACENDGFF